MYFMAIIIVKPKGDVIMSKIKKVYNENKRLVFGAFILGISWVFIYSIALNARQNESTPFYNQIIRLHILAHDDSPEEQALKLAVRDGVWEYMDNLISQASSISEAREIIYENLDYIEVLAKEISDSFGDYNSHVIAARFEEDLNFPAVSYSGTVFPQGRYQALQISIGDASGKNWWCVMFPPMCIMEISGAEIVPSMSNPDETIVRPRFKLAESFVGFFN